MYSQLQLCGASLEGRHLYSFFYFIGSNFSAKKMSVGYVCMCVHRLDFNLKKVYEIVQVPLLMRPLSGSCRFMRRQEGRKLTRGLSVCICPLPFCRPHPFLCCTLHAGLSPKLVHPSILPLPLALCTQIPHWGCSPVVRVFVESSLSGS